MKSNRLVIALTSALLACGVASAMAQEPQGSKTEAGANPASGGTSGGPSQEAIGGNTAPTQPVKPNASRGMNSTSTQGSPTKKN
jgi:hypothetical protein